MSETSSQNDVVIETARLFLRTLRLDDVDDLLGIYSDPIAMEHYPSTRTREETIERIEENLNRYEEHGHGFWACVRKDDDTYLGNCGLLIQEVEGESLIEVGYHFLRKHWGHGYASEAAIACRDHAFRTLDIDRVISLIVDANTPSIKVARRNGMTLRSRTHKWDLDVGVYVIMRDEWMNVNGLGKTSA